MESDFQPRAVFATLFLPTESVAYVDGRRDPPAVGEGAESVAVRALSASALDRLLTDLERSIGRARAGGRAGPFPPVRAYAGRFYPGEGYYIFWSNCNTWTVDRLRSAGLAGSSAGVLLSSQVADRLRGFR